MNHETPSSSLTGALPGPPPAPGHRSYYLSVNPMVPWPRLRPPVDWTEWFGRPAPLAMEIGFGNGEALVQRAQKNPDVNYIGLELAWASTKRALRRLAKNQIPNVRLMQLDAHLALKWFFAPRTLFEIVSLFPAPWPKDRHETRRLFSREFLTLAGSRLMDSGRFLIVTDHQAFFEWILEQAEDSGMSVQWKPSPAGFDTKYERKWREAGQRDFFEIVLAKSEHRDIPQPAEAPVNSFRLNHFDPDRFEPPRVTGEITVLFKEFVFDPKREKALTRALVVEGRLRQEVWILIEKRDDYWHLGLAHSNHVLPTAGVKKALELAKEGMV